MGAKFLSVGLTTKVVLLGTAGHTWKAFMPAEMGMDYFNATRTGAAVVAQQ